MSDVPLDLTILKAIPRYAVHVPRRPRSWSQLGVLTILTSANTSKGLNWVSGVWFKVLSLLLHTVIRSEKSYSSGMWSSIRGEMTFPQSHRQLLLPIQLEGACLIKRSRWAVGLLGVGILLSLVGWSWAQEVGSTELDHTEKENWQPTKSKIIDLENKAAERDVLARKNFQLKKENNELRLQLGQSGALLSKEKQGYLISLERKAKEHDVIQRMLVNREQRIKELTELVDEEGAFNARLRDEIEGLLDKNLDLAAKLAESEELRLALKETINQLWLGQYEYYEIKKGETIESIASLPHVYGDVNKAAWIRQANQTHLASTEHLVEGQVLIIPRFPHNGRFEF